MWYESDPARLVIEKRAMEARFPQFRLIQDGQKLTWLVSSSRTVEIRMRSPLFIRTTFQSSHQMSIRLIQSLLFGKTNTLDD